MTAEQGENAPNAPAEWSIVEVLGSDYRREGPEVCWGIMAEYDSDYGFVLYIPPRTSLPMTKDEFRRYETGEGFSSEADSFEGALMIPQQEAFFRLYTWSKAWHPGDEPNEDPDSIIQISLAQVVAEVPERFHERIRRETRDRIELLARITYGNPLHALNTFTNELEFKGLVAAYVEAFPEDAASLPKLIKPSKTQTDVDPGQDATNIDIDAIIRQTGIEISDNFLEGNDRD